MGKLFQDKLNPQCIFSETDVNNPKKTDNKTKLLKQKSQHDLSKTNKFCLLLPVEHLRIIIIIILFGWENPKPKHY